MNTKITKQPLSRSSRRGSVLILVVALLVLMALIGTAWISTSRVDRAASINTIHNTEIELAIEGVVNMASAAIVGDASDAGALRRGDGYVHTDSTVTDAFLASRLPVFLDEVAPVWTDVPATGFADPPMYEKGRLVRVGGATGTFYICLETHRANSSDSPGSGGKWAPLGSYDLNSTNPIDNPVFWPATSRVQPPDVKFEDVTGQVGGYTQRTAMAPTSVAFNGRQYPAFRFYHTGLGTWVPVLAADTDGDGLADSNYFKLPIGRVNGLDYYAAVRIVDNNSAVNASVAYGPTGTDADKIADFPSSLSIRNLFAGTGPEIDEQATRFELAVANELNDELLVPLPQPVNYNGYENPINDQTSSNPRTRGDFEHPDRNEGGIAHLHWMLRGRRPRNPGYWTDGGSNFIRMNALPVTDGAALAYRGGTLLNPDAMVRPTNIASSLIEQLLYPTLYFGADNHPAASGGNLNGAYRVDVGQRSSYPDTTAASWQELFARNYDWYERWVPGSAKETANDRSTYRNRRSLMTVSNPVSNAVPSRLKPRFGLTGAQLPGAWSRDLSYDVGDYVTSNGLTYVCLSPIPAGVNIAPGTVSPTALPGDHPSRVLNWEPRPFEHFPTKASANAGSFGQLYLAFWQTMAENASLKRPPTAGEPSPPTQQTPFKDAFRLNSAAAPADMDNPYYAGRFIRGALGVATPLFPPFSASGGVDQHPLRMLRSPFRSVPAPSATLTNAFDATTPRLMVDHTMRLRAALAAANAIDMRDSDDNVTAREINVGVTLNRGGSSILETESTDVNVIGRARVYGHERQPFITEIFAQTDTSGTSDGTNPNGYVAVELYNPYPVHIDIRYCKIATIDRTPGNVRNLVVSESAVPAANALQAPSLANAESNVSATTNPWLIPANGFLVLESYDDTAIGGVTGSPNPPTNILPAAAYRPLSSGLPPTGAITPTGTTPHNYTYVPNLHKVLDKEMVLVRPLNALVVQTGLDWLAATNVTALRYVEPPLVALYPGTPAVDMAPLDSYDFTGIPNPDGAAVSNSPTPRLSPTHAYAWHYARPYIATAAADSTKAWRFVYPGRYDGFQTLQGTRGPRQQGTQEAGLGTVVGWDPAGTGLREDPWNPGSPTPIVPVPGITLSDLPVAAPNNQATYHPYEYAIQLINSVGSTDGAVGPNPVRADTGNKFPFGGYARNVDVLEIPYIGSYRIKITAVGVPPAPPTVSGVTSQVPSNPQNTTDALYNQVLELNAITMDSVFAEDTDPFNHYNVTTPATDWTVLPPEQIGRFTPSRFDLEIGAAGTVDTATFAVNDPTALPTQGTLEDADRNEPGNPWNGYDLEIVDGPGKGQTRPVVNFSGGTFTVYPNWEVQPTNASRYVLRRGTLWRVVPGGGMIRTSGNKYWASDVLDYVTADSPQDDYLPAADPGSYDRGNIILPPQSVANADASKPGAISYGWKTGGTGASIDGTGNLSDLPNAYVGGWIEMLSGNAAGEVRAISTYDAGSRRVTIAAPFVGSTANNDRFRIFARNSEDLTGTQGLVNINTAPWPVLAMIPWTRSEDVAGGATPAEIAVANATLAQRIAVYRDGDPSAGIAPHGPFRSLFDLYRVPDFFYHQRNLLLRIDPGNTVGDNMPRGTGAVDNVRYDFQEQYLLLNRVSNMITTRSDTFTVYVLVQGWRGAGTTTPELVVQRRRAYTADRTGLNPANRELPIQYLYND